MMDIAPNLLERERDRVESALANRWISQADARAALRSIDAAERRHEDRLKPNHRKGATRGQGRARG